MSVHVTEETLESVRLAVRAADDKGAISPIALSVSELFPFADAFLVMSGEVERNVQAISDAVEETLNTAGVRTVRREGRGGGRWVLLDFGNLIVHVFHQEEREFYGLERLWKDCPSIDLATMLDAAPNLQIQAAAGVE